MNKQQSQENCTDCQQTTVDASSGMRGAIGSQTDGIPKTDPTIANDDITYDEGEGVKSNIVLTGPLSEMLSQQLQVIFTKTPLGGGEKPNKEETVKKDENAVTSVINQAAETMALDTAIASAVDDVDSLVRKQVVMRNFDVVSLKEHLSRAHDNAMNDEDRLESAGNACVAVVGTTKELEGVDPNAIIDAVPYATDVDFVIVERPESDLNGVKVEPKGAPLMIAGKVIPQSTYLLDDEEDKEVNHALEEIREDLTGRGVKSNVYPSLEAYFIAKSKR